MVRCGVMRHIAAQCGAIWYGAVLCGAVRCAAGKARGCGFILMFVSSLPPSQVSSRRLADYWLRFLCLSVLGLTLPVAHERQHQHQHQLMISLVSSTPNRCRLGVVVPRSVRPYFEIDHFSFNPYLTLALTLALTLTFPCLAVPPPALGCSIFCLSIDRSIEKSVCRMYAEVSKSIGDPKAALANVPPKQLKGPLRAERHQAEREMWRQELEVSVFYTVSWCGEMV